MRTIIALAIMVALSGCTALFGPGDYSEYSLALQAHSDAESRRIVAQSSAIAEAAAVPTSTPTERALLATIAMMQIERLQPIPLGIAKPTTGMDVAAKIVDVVPFVASTTGIVYLGTKAVQAAGNVEIGSGATVTGSLNRPTATSIGDGATATMQPYDVRPEVVQLEVVQP